MNEEQRKFLKAASDEKSMWGRNVRKNLIDCGVGAAIADTFIAYHAANLWVWDAFQLRATLRIQAGETEITGDQVFGDIRAHHKKKPNFSLAYCYVLAFVSKYPGLKDHFYFFEG